LDSLNKISDELFDALPPYKEIDHKIEVVLGLIPLSTTPYRLNQKELDKFKK
jgi:hypothetical protein